MLTPLNRTVYAPLRADNEPVVANNGWFSWANVKVRRFSQCLGQAFLYATNVAFFAGHVSNKVPKSVTKTSLLILSGIGFVPLPFTTHLLIKTGKDSLFAIKNKNLLVLFLSALRIMETVSNLALMSTSFAASILGMQGKEKQQADLYQNMIVWGETTIGVSIFLTVADMGVDFLVLRMLKKDPPQPGIHYTVDALGGCVVEAPTGYIASMIRFSMDKDTLDKLLNTIKTELNEEKRIELFNTVRSNIQLQQNVDLGGNLFITILNYVLMAIERKYTPNSLVSASLTLGTSTVASLRIAVETIREVKQRNRMEKIINQ